MHSNASYYSPRPDFSFNKANILIDQNGHACLADFGFLTIVLDPTSASASSSLVIGGTTRWMSPELLSSDPTGPEVARLTKRSDCYALGMVIYEVLSGQPPFAPFQNLTVIMKVVQGERPGRPNGPEGARFTDELWRTLNRCWEPLPECRPSAGAVLECLERVSGAREAPSHQEDQKVAAGRDHPDNTGDTFGIPCWFKLLCLVALLCVITCLSQFGR